MRKIVSLILICILLLCFTSCEGKPTVYYGYDYEYMMVNGVKYIPFETPIDLKKESYISYVYDSLAPESAWYESDIDYYPFMLPFGDNRYEDVVLPGNIDVKCHFRFGSYCLEKDKEKVEELLSNFAWSDVVGIQDEASNPEIGPVILSEELTRFILESLSSWDGGDSGIRLYSDEERIGAAGVPEIYRYDNQMIFRKRIADFEVRESGTYLIPLRVYVTDDIEKADYNLKDMTNLKVPEELAKEFEPFLRKE